MILILIWYNIRVIREVQNLERVYSWPQIYEKYVKLKTK